MFWYDSPSRLRLWLVDCFLILSIYKYIYIDININIYIYISLLLLLLQETLINIQVSYSSNNNNNKKQKPSIESCMGNNSTSRQHKAKNYDKPEGFVFLFFIFSYLVVQIPHLPIAEITYLRRARSVSSRYTVSSSQYLTFWKWKLLSHVRLFATPWTIQSMDFSRPEY